MPKISIIVPVYNKKEYILRTLESITNQVYKDYEVIIVDDGSTDGSSEIIQKYITSYDNFKYYKIDNGGVSNARNVGMRNSSGEWIQFLDGDDLIDKNYLENIKNKLNVDLYDIVFTSITKTDLKGKIIEKIEPLKEGISSKSDLIRMFAEMQYQNGYFGYVSNKIINRKLIDKLNAKFETNVKLSEDLLFYIQLYQNVKKVYFCRDNSCYYLQLEHEYVDGVNMDYESQLHIHIKIAEWFKKEDIYDQYKHILDDRVSRYVYYCIFYSRKDETKKTAVKLYNDNNVIKYVSQDYFSGFEKIIMKMFIKKKMNMLITLLNVRNFVRNIYRRIRK